MKNSSGMQAKAYYFHHQDLIYILLGFIWTYFKAPICDYTGEKLQRLLLQSLTPFVICPVLLEEQVLKQNHASAFNAASPERISLQIKGQIFHNHSLRI